VTLLRDTFKLYGGNLLLIPAGVALTVVSARMLGPEVRGLLTAAFIVPNFAAQFATLGMPTAGNYFIERRGEDPRRVGSTLLWSGAVVGLVLAVVLLAVFAFIPGARHEKIGLAEQALVLLVLPVSLPSTYISTLFTARRWHGRRLINGLLSPVIRIAAIFLVAGVLVPPSEDDYGTFALLVVTLSIASALLTVVAAYLQRDWVMGKPSPALASQMAKFGGWSMVSTGAMFLLHFGDQYMLPKMRPEDGMVLLGVYTVSYSVFTHAMGASRAFSQSYFHRSLETPLETADADIAVLTRRGVQGVTILAAGAYVAAPLLVWLIGGDEFTDAALPLQILLLAAPAYMASEILWNASFNRGLTRNAAMPAVAGTVLNIVLNIVLIPDYGMVGCAWATVAGFWLMAVLRWFSFAKLAGRKLALEVFAFQNSDLIFFGNVVKRTVRAIWSRVFPKRSAKSNDTDDTGPDAR